MKDCPPCNPFGDNCLDFSDDRSIVVLKDKRSKSKSEYRAENNNKKNLVCLRVDGCLITNIDGKKCDYLLLISDEKIAHFIELKGGGISDAIKQLTNSVNQIMPHLKKHEYQIAFAKVSLSKTPKILPAKDWLDLRRLMQTYNGDAFRQNSPYQDIL